MSDMPDARPQGKDTAKEEGGRPALTKISVRGVDAAVYNDFRIEAMRYGFKTGDALTEAMRLWIKDEPEVNT